MRSIAICDDDPRDLEGLRQLTAEYLIKQGLALTIETYSDGAALLAALVAAPEQYILLILDILLGERNGVTLAKILREQSVHARLIFISISPDFALDGYKVNADDYLVKPLPTGQLEQALDRIFSLNAMLSIKTAAGIHMVHTSDILYIESEGHYVIVATDTELLRSRATLSELEERLHSDDFIRCHKGFLVNLSHVSELLDTDLVLNCGRRVPVGRSYYNDVKTHLADYAFLRLPSLL